MKKVYEDLVENEFAIANREYRLKDPDEQKLHSIAIESVKVYKPKKAKYQSCYPARFYFNICIYFRSIY